MKSPVVYPGIRVAAQLANTFFYAEGHFSVMCTTHSFQVCEVFYLQQLKAQYLAAFLLRNTTLEDCFLMIFFF